MQSFEDFTIRPRGYLPLLIDGSFTSGGNLGFSVGHYTLVVRSFMLDSSWRSHCLHSCLSATLESSRLRSVLLINHLLIILSLLL